MLNHLRGSAHGIFGKILLGLLVLSFGIWGIGDMFRNGGGSNAVATVGKTVISVQEFNRVLRARQEELQARLGKAYNPELMKKLGLERAVAQELINNALITNEAASLGIVIGDDVLVKAIGDNPAFHDRNGNFDKALYLATLRNNGMAEQHYVDSLRKHMAVKLLTDTLAANIIVPDTLLRALYYAREERRDATLYLIPASALAQVPEPSEKEIQSYYEAHSQSFMTPEYRDVSYVDMRLSDIQSRIEISEDDIKQAYNDRLQDFQKPERRAVEQLLFANEEEAQKAADALAHGARFSDLAQKEDILNKGKTSLGTVGRQDLPAEEATPIFSAKAESATRPIQSEFGWHVFYISKIIPGSVLPLEQARPEIVKDLSAAKAGETLSRLVNQVQDDMAGGMPLAEAAKKAGFKVETVKQVTQEGKNPEGKKVSLPAYDSFLNTAFSTGEKENSQAVQAQDGSYFILHVDADTPAHIMPLAQVKDRIVSVLKEEKTEEALKAAAQNVAEKLRAGKKPEMALSTITTGDIKRRSAKTADGMPLPEGLVQELFSLSSHQFTRAYRAKKDEYMVGELAGITPAPASADPKLLQGMGEELKASLSEEILDNYLIYLRGKYRVSINESLFKAASSEGEE